MTTSDGLLGMEIFETDIFDKREHVENVISKIKKSEMFEMYDIDIMISEIPLKPSFNKYSLLLTIEEPFSRDVYKVVIYGKKEKDLGRVDNGLLFLEITDGISEFKFEDNVYGVHSIETAIKMLKIEKKKELERRLGVYKTFSGSLDEIRLDENVFKDIESVQKFLDIFHNSPKNQNYDVELSLEDNERAMTPHHRYELLIKITDKSLGLINTGSIFACTSFKEDKSSSNISVRFSKGIPNISMNKDIDYISQIFLVNDELNMKYLSQVPKTKEIKIKEQMESRGVILPEDKWNELLSVLDEDKKVAMDMMRKIVGI